MQSFRTEIENPVVQKDIIDLEKKIRLFKEGQLDEESFRSLRLARGVYGQRQQGVQMIRIKLPLGIVRAEQLKRLADVTDQYSDGILHITTRQDIQIHHVSLDDTPQLWNELEKDEITLREACGNTVRNITASPLAGVDPDEPFDVTPYGWTLFEYFLRNPIGQELGRKFKIAISSSESDDARTYLHDFGLIPKIENGVKGFKVLIGGGLGAQAFVASVLKEFVPVDRILEVATATLKVFDKYGERNKRNKARLKYLIKEKGLDFVREQIEIELRNLPISDFELIEPKSNPAAIPNLAIQIPDDLFEFARWRSTNVYEQKEKEEVAVLLKVRNGNFSTETARSVAEIISTYSREAARLTIEQNILIRSVRTEYLGNLFNELEALNLHDFGGGSIRDITSCPGTKTCNLGITATYSVSEVIEELLVKEYEEVILEHQISIKISGCMNACGQHTVADIGFHGSTIKANGAVFPALQLLLGGSNRSDGNADFADKVIKFPSRRIENVIRTLLDDFLLNKYEEETFRDFYTRYGKNYFYELLKSIADVKEWTDNELLDWGSEQRFFPEIGIGECAGVKIDLVKTLIYEAEEKIDQANYFLTEGKLNDALYTIYSALVEGAKAFLIKKGDKTNSKKQIADEFEAYFHLVKDELNELSFVALLNKSNAYSAEFSFVETYLKQAERFLKRIDELTVNYAEAKLTNEHN